MAIAVFVGSNFTEFCARLIGLPRKVTLEDCALPCELKTHRRTESPCDRVNPGRFAGNN